VQLLVGAAGRRAVREVRAAEVAARRAVEHGGAHARHVRAARLNTAGDDAIGDLGEDGVDRHAAKVSHNLMARKASPGHTHPIGRAPPAPDPRGA
jgi:hypothetical protein